MGVEKQVRTRVLWAGSPGNDPSFPTGAYRVDVVRPAARAVEAVAAAQAQGDPYGVCFLEWGEGGSRPDDLLRLDPGLFLVLEVEDAEAGDAAEFGAWVRPDRCLVVNRPVRPVVRRGLAEHLGARWIAEADEKGSRALLEADASRDRARGRRSEERLQVLYGIVEKLHGSSSLEGALRVTLGEIAGFLGARTGSVLVLEGPDRLRVLEAVGPQREKILGIEVPLDQSRIARYALEGREPILVEDMQESERFQESEEGIRFRARSILSIPLFAQGDALGVLNFGGDAQESSFTPQDRDLVVTLGRHVAVALEKARLVEGLRQTVAESIRALAGAIEAKDRYTRGHSDRVTHYCRLTALALGVAEAEVDVIVRSAILHDVGKIGVPEAVLHKPGRLTDEEFGYIQRHPAVGVDIVREIGAMTETLPIIQCHHERFDGRGYPRGVAGGAIPLGARIMAVADTFDAMTSDRPYRDGLPAQTAFEEIDRCAGAQFDPDIARAFLDGAPRWPDA
ncbi:MAG: GAF domain-containing protein [Deltaproteobacteria bacterium]|nr:GAF domain-containing protein [Deltaproteobacteria bacterium]